MSAETTREVVRGFFEAMQRGDLDALAELIDEGVRWWVLGAGEFDRAGIGQVHMGLVAATEVRSFTMIDAIAAGDRIAVEARGEFVFKGGRRMENSFHLAFTVKDGKITAVREYLDTAAVQAFQRGDG